MTFSLDYILLPHKVPINTKAHTNTFNKYLSSYYVLDTMEDSAEDIKM